MSTNKAIGIWPNAHNNAHMVPVRPLALSSFQLYSTNREKPPLKPVAELRKLTEVNHKSSRSIRRIEQRRIRRTQLAPKRPRRLRRKKSRQDHTPGCRRRSRLRVRLRPLPRDWLIPWWRSRRPHRTQLRDRLCGAQYVMPLLSLVRTSCFSAL
jgi:hypothetical protein